MAIARPTCGELFGSVSLSSHLAAVWGSSTQHNRQEEAKRNSGYPEFCAQVLYLKSVYSLLF